TAATATAARAAPRPAATGAPAPEGVVNINTATAEELVRVPGIGPARAAAIVHLRERAHRFNHAEDLLRVRGIGRVGFRRMRPYLALTGETTLASRPGRAPRVRPDAATE
ncbi:MAG: helix-hairpin-helix domain-containing protein, partial [Myxococcales bacterium]|nr:helix-hairpin-helix domain-containing protein [Myxococcales bacterium]